MTKEKFSPTRRSVLRLGAMSALGVGIGIPAVSGSVAATACPRTPGYWANHPEAWEDVEAIPYDLYGYEFTPDNLLDKAKGRKDRIMAKHLMATILNFQWRKKEDYVHEDGFVGDKCVDVEIKYGPYAGSTVRDVKRLAEDWLMDAEMDQKSWYVNGVDGEPIKNTLDAFNNDPGMLGLKKCPCYGDDGDDYEPTKKPNPRRK